MNVEEFYAVHVGFLALRFCCFGHNCIHSGSNYALFVKTNCATHKPFLVKKKHVRYKISMQLVTSKTEN
jgi:hypothetical protein